MPDRSESWLLGQVSSPPGQSQMSQNSRSPVRTSARTPPPPLPEEPVPEPVPECRCNWARAGSDTHLESRSWPAPLQRGGCPGPRKPWGPRPRFPSIQVGRRVHGSALPSRVPGASHARKARRSPGARREAGSLPRGLQRPQPDGPEQDGWGQRVPRATRPLQRQAGHPPLPLPLPLPLLEAERC
jgi:hypothetical protein